MTAPVMSPEHTPTPSLRRRATLAVVALIALLLVAVGIGIDVVFGARLADDLHDDLADRVNQVPGLLEAGLTAPELVDALQGQEFRVQVATPDGRVFGDAQLDPVSRQPPPISQPAPVDDQDPWPPSPWAELPSLRITRDLPDGALLTITAESRVVSEARTNLRHQMLIGALGTLVLAALAVRFIAGRALSPLQHLTATADGITGGDRGKRIHPDRPQTELGHAAAAFDRMLDALESAERRANDAAAAAQRAELQSRKFLSDASHELRTPLAGIQVIADQLIADVEARPDPTGVADDRTTRARRYAALLAGETRKAARLVNDLLDIARIDAGVELRRERTDIARIAAAEVDRTAMLAPGLEVACTGAERLYVDADPTKISQILANLLDNARRHTPPAGRITVNIENFDGAAQVTVRDTGSGVPDSEDREKIFERFVRLGDARDRDSGGSGLGLSIARGLAEAHDGTLVCLPSDRGAAFRLSLPGGQPPNQPPS